MHGNVVSRVMLLRDTLKLSSGVEGSQDLLQQANVLMRMLLQHEVSIDFTDTARQNTVLAKVAELVQMCAAIHDDELKANVSVHLQSITSACVSSCMTSASAKPNSSDAMSTQDKLQRVRSSLLSSFQA